MWYRSLSRFGNGLRPDLPHLGDNKILFSPDQAVMPRISSSTVKSSLVTLPMQCSSRQGHQNTFDLPSVKDRDVTKIKLSLECHAVPEGKRQGLTLCSLFLFIGGEGRK